MDIIISSFKVLKDILDFVVTLINIFMFLKLREEKKRLNSNVNHRYKKYKKRVPSRRKHH
ncbi:Uncharacterised protein [[Clostridium] sordellii]|uniref:hypothetical protein n=1 Tax=Paraclostridium sordellii TaxID=1505 RepID=UPI0005DEB7B9|nr:hypothetical protein [Paeniclostridium sordellii]CEN25431.1 Uncharacterised protein [[Clostridium] sordellii] [Paeniclostridium sordellii]